eukprot:1736576-Rhodomonas_salina.1
MPQINLGDVVPNFSADTSQGPVKFHEWISTPAGRFESACSCALPRMLTQTCSCVRIGSPVCVEPPCLPVRTTPCALCVKRQRAHVLDFVKYPSPSLMFSLGACCSWTCLFSHPADYTPVCTTELGTVALIQEEFTNRNCK